LLREFIEPLGMTITAFAEHIGIGRDRLSEIINGRRRVTPNTAMRLSKALGTTVQFWINVQTSTDLWAAMHSDEAKEIDKVKPLCA
jgi:addiction module HigA family antidote